MDRIERYAPALIALLIACGSDHRGSDYRDAQGDGAPIDSPVDVVSFASLKIRPSAPELVCAFGHAGSLQLELWGIRDDGSEERLEAEWHLEPTPLAGLESAGLLTSDCSAVGVVEVQASSDHGAASARVTVRIEWNYREPLVRNDPRWGDEARDDPLKAVEVVYPLDEALMPVNALPPRVQWRGQEASDLVRVTISRPFVSLVGVLSGDQLGWKPSEMAWRLLLRTSVGSPITLQVDRLTSAGELWRGEPSTLQIVEDRLEGDLIYYEVYAPEGIEQAIPRVVRISADRAGTPEVLVPSPPLAPGFRASGPPHPARDCVGCHDVSRNGELLALIMRSAMDTTVFDLTADLSGVPTPSLFDDHYGNFPRWESISFDPTGELLLVSQRSTDNALIDPRSGELIPSPTLPGESDHPEVLGQVSSFVWSPDGSRVALIGHTVGTFTYSGWARPAGGHTLGDVMLLERTGPTDFGEATFLHRGADLSSAPEGGVVDSHVAFSPDGRWLVFQHGTNSFSRTNEGWNEEFTIVDNPGAIYLISVEGGDPIRLDRAMGGPETMDAYNPYFSPIITGEGDQKRFWLAFSSRREYGNLQRGDLPIEERRATLWVTSIDVQALEEGRDPSSVPYWLPEQSEDPIYSAFRARWVWGECRERGEACSADSQCCSRSCDLEEGACDTPPPALCHVSGQTCSQDADCCEERSCIGNICQVRLE